MSERFAKRLARQNDTGETMLLECYVYGHWNPSKLRQWMTGEYGASSGIVQSFTAECGLRDIEQQVTGPRPSRNA
jgi:hypothetical protein